MKPARFVPPCLLLLLSMLMLPHFPFLPIPPKVAADTLSSVYVTKVQNCCILPNASSPVFTVNVMMNLATNDLITGFDVRLNYTNFFSPSPPTHGIVKAASLDYSNNYFANNFGGQFATQASCIDDVIFGPGQGALCATDDVSGGQVHVAQSLVGTNMTGPVINALLFSVTFTVNATGTSLMYIERAHLVNPGGIPPNPHFIPVTTAAAVFGNDQLVAFYDYQSTRSPSVLAGVSTTFDASSSFRSGSSPTILSNPKFVWDFGDGNTATTANAIISHTFQQAGNFTVSLNVTDSFQGFGSFQRVVQVAPQLGTLLLQLKNQNGAAISEIITVKLHNLTNPVPPLCSACTKVMSAGGFVDFIGLTPGSYSMNFTGQGVVSSGKVVTLDVGWPNMQTVYLQEIQPPGTNYFPLLIFGLVVGVGLGLGGISLYLRSRSAKKLASSGGINRKTKRQRP